MQWSTHHCFKLTRCLRLNNTLILFLFYFFPLLTNPYRGETIKSVLQLRALKIELLCNGALVTVLSSHKNLDWVCGYTDQLMTNRMTMSNQDIAFFFFRFKEDFTSAQETKTVKIYQRVSSTTGWHISYHHICWSCLIHQHYSDESVNIVSQKSNRFPYIFGNISLHDCLICRRFLSGTYQPRTPNS